MATTQPTVTPTSAPPAAGLHPAAPAALGLALRHDPALAAYPQPSDVILSCPKEPASALHPRPQRGCCASTGTQLTATWAFAKPRVYVF